jgi:hypothetical protein
MTLELSSSLGSRMSRPKRETNVPNTTLRVLSVLWSLTKSGNSCHATSPTLSVLPPPPPLAYCACPTLDMPAQHANNAAAAVVSIYRDEAVQHTNFSKASSNLSKALSASIGSANETHLRTFFSNKTPTWCRD